MSVDLPLPVLPTMAVVSPGPRRERDAAQDRLLGARIAELDVAELDDAALRRDRTGATRLRPGRGWSARSRGPPGCGPPETAARGTRMNMNTAVRTANRIWSRYCRKAVRLPIGSSPVVDAHGPEPHDRHGREVEDRGHRRDRQREQAVDLRATCRTGRGWPSSKRASSCAVRTKARMTRTPASVSRMTWLIRSSLTCTRPEQRDGPDMTRPMTSDHQRQDDHAGARTAGRPSGGP